MRGINRDISFSGDQIGYGYVCIPENIDRSKYIKTCFRKEKISIILDQGGSMIMDCYITKESLQNITFPESAGKLGALVVFVVQKFNSKPIIIGTLSKTNESQLLSENTFKNEVKTDDNLVSIVGSGDGSLTINVKNKIRGGKISVNVIGEDAELNLNSSGTTNINSTGDVNVKSSGNINSIYLREGVESIKLLISENGLRYEDENNSFTINKNESKIIHNDGSESLLLGDTTQAEIEKLKTYVDTMKIALDSSFVIIDAIVTGASTPFSTAMSTITSGDFSQIKSTKSFID